MWGTLASCGSGPGLDVTPLGPTTLFSSPTLTLQTGDPQPPDSQGEDLALTRRLAEPRLAGLCRAGLSGAEDLNSLSAPCSIHSSSDSTGGGQRHTPWRAWVQSPVPLNLFPSNSYSGGQQVMAQAAGPSTWETMEAQARLLQYVGNEAMNKNCLLSSECRVQYCQTVAGWGPRTPRAHTSVTEHTVSQVLGTDARGRTKPLMTGPQLRKTGSGTQNTST